MSVLQALILGLIQGLTEFLPISSSGHLVLGQKLLGFSKPPVAFDILVHVGTLIAIFIFFRKELLFDFKNFLSALGSGNLKKIPKIFWLVVIGTIPAVVAGFLVNSFLEEIFNSTLMVGFSLIFTSLLLASTKFLKRGSKKINEVALFDGLTVGFFQALAILPGISRSGSTVVSGLWREIKREDAFRLSFYLAIPAVLGAQVLQFKRLVETGGNNFSYFLGFLSAILAGILSLRILKKMLLAGKLAYFGAYCFIIGSLVILLNLY